DLLQQALPTGIADATNTDQNSSNSIYTAEVRDLYLALSQHENIPVDYLDEEDVLDRTLARYRVLYVTGPDLPDECEAAIEAWVRRGGILVTCAEAGTRDRYDSPSSRLDTFSGI